jgi:hypothetical protein
MDILLLLIILRLSNVRIALQKLMRTGYRRRRRHHHDV